MSASMSFSSHLLPRKRETLIPVSYHYLVQPFHPWEPKSFSFSGPRTYNYISSTLYLSSPDRNSSKCLGSLLPAMTLQPSNLSRLRLPSFPTPYLRFTLSLTQYVQSSRSPRPLPSPEGSTTASIAQCQCWTDWLKVLGWISTRGHKCACRFLYLR